MLTLDMIKSSPLIFATLWSIQAKQMGIIDEIVTFEHFDMEKESGLFL
jgi:hypothetical protein